MDKKLEINDLLATLNHSQSKDLNFVPSFVSHVDVDRNKKVQNISSSKQQMMKRESNYEMSKEEMDKWIGIVKLNREKESLNFVKKDVADLKVNFFPAQPISDLHQKIENKLKSMNIQSQKAVIQNQKQILGQVEPEQAKRRLHEARKHRTAIFYEEQKRRRISKIKSKLYHKIKKRQRMREEVKKFDQMNQTEKNDYIENLTKKRIKERITLRHKTKNKHIQNLLRFNRSEKNGIQSSINEVNEARRKELERVHQDVLEQVSQDYDDENFREEAMKDLEEEIKALQNQEMKPEQEDYRSGNPMLDDLKFMKIGKKNKREKEKKQAYRLLRKIANGEELSENDVESEMEGQRNEMDEEQERDGMEVSRKIYGKDVGDAHLQHEKPIKNKNMQSQLQEYLAKNQQNDELKPNNRCEDELIEGINLKKLQEKYQPDRIPIDLSTLIAGNKEIYEEENEVARENMRQFHDEKALEYEKQINQDNKDKKLKGWGNWVGPGIQEKKVDPREELGKKLKKIAEIKEKRKDSSLAHVTINESRNKKLSQYFVKNLPYNYSNADQFDFMQNEAIGPQWNSLNQFKDNVKPKIITKKGQVIEAARLPKKVLNLNKH